MFSKIHAKLARNLYLDLNRDISQTIMLVSTPRSGSTWLGETIQSWTKARLIFEPFHSGQTNFGLPKTRPLYLRHNGEYSQYQPIIEDILKGNIRSRWTDYLNKTIFVKQRLIKAIHANLMLGWLTFNYPQVKYIYLFRHPFAVALSLSKMDNSSKKAKVFLEASRQEELVNDFLGDKLFLLETIQEPFAANIWRWCVEQIVPLSKLNSHSSILLVCYEQLCLDPTSEIKRISKFLDISLDESQVNTLSQKLTKPSSSTFAVLGKNSDSRAEKAAKYQDYQPEKLIDWRGKITQSQMDYGLKLLSIFGLDKLYTEELKPNMTHQGEILSTFASSPDL